MKTFFDPAVQQELMERLERLNTASPRQWGTMDVAQMLAHCTAGMGMPLGDLPVKASVMILVGCLMKRITTSRTPFRHGVPTAPELTMTGPKELEAERARLKACMARLAAGPGAIRNFKHPFFGTLTVDQWGSLSYKHLDHHFRQFGG